jgi:adenylate kinase family enzyme
LKKCGVRGFLLDGYPRTLEQVKELDTMLADLGVNLDGVLVVSVDARDHRSRHRPDAHRHRPTAQMNSADALMRTTR